MHVNRVHSGYRVFYLPLNECLFGDQITRDTGHVCGGGGGGYIIIIGSGKLLINMW